MAAQREDSAPSRASVLDQAFHGAARPEDWTVPPRAWDTAITFGCPWLVGSGRPRFRISGAALFLSEPAYPATLRPGFFNKPARPTTTAPPIARVLDDRISALLEGRFQSGVMTASVAHEIGRVEVEHSAVSSKPILSALFCRRRTTPRAAVGP